MNSFDRIRTSGRYTVSSLEKFIYRCKIVRKELGRVAENRKETGLLIVNELEFCNGSRSLRENELLKGRKGQKKVLPLNNADIKTRELEISKLIILRLYL